MAKKINCLKVRRPAGQREDSGFPPTLKLRRTGESQYPENYMKIYLAGSIPKGDAAAKITADWRKQYTAVFEKFLAADLFPVAEYSSLLRLEMNATYIL